MFKKHIKNSIIVIFFVAIMSTMTFAQGTIVDTNSLDKGLVGINYSQSKDNMKVMISKGTSKEHYDLKSNMMYPLQFGNGVYTIQVLERVNGNKYRQVGKETVSLKLEDEKQVFLQSTQIVNWNKDMSAIKKAEELVKDCKTEDEKLQAIYDYVVKNVSYDHKKASSVQIGYLPSIDNTLVSKSGICYDYAALTGAMLRSVGIPSKLVMGYTSNIKSYHAWNEVYVDGKWKIIDTTYDSAYASKSIAINMIKSNKSYQSTKVY